jgi:hypothetical protein
MMKVGARPERVENPVVSAALAKHVDVQFAHGHLAPLIDRDQEHRRGHPFLRHAGNARRHSTRSLAVRLREKLAALNESPRPAPVEVEIR